MRCRLEFLIFQSASQTILMRKIEASREKSVKISYFRIYLFTFFHLFYLFLISKTQKEQRRDLESRELVDRTRRFDLITKNKKTLLIKHGHPYKRTKIPFQIFIGLKTSFTTLLPSINILLLQFYYYAD